MLETTPSGIKQSDRGAAIVYVTPLPDSGE